MEGRALTDKELMFEVKDGDLDKLGVLFERHHRALYSFLLRLTGSVEAAEDILQEVFLRLLKYRHTYRGDSEFVVWMFRIARNARADHFRKNRLASSDDQEEELVSTNLSPDDEVEKSQTFDLVHAALNKLGADDREVLLLSRFHEIKYKEIAEMLGCLEGTVKARVHRATKRLRDAFYQLSGERA